MQAGNKWNQFAWAARRKDVAHKVENYVRFFFFFLFFSWSQNETTCVHTRPIFHSERHFCSARPITIFTKQYRQFAGKQPTGNHFRRGFVWLSSLRPRFSWTGKSLRTPLLTVSRLARSLGQRAIPSPLTLIVRDDEVANKKGENSCLAVAQSRQYRSISLSLSMNGRFHRWRCSPVRYETTRKPPPRLLSSPRGCTRAS